jgi:hypothetical protein
MVTFCPSTMPYSAKPLRKASTKCALSLADRALRNPMAGLFEDCAFVASGQTAEPAITLMTSRRLIAAFRGFRQVILQAQATRLEAADHVRFGSKADISQCNRHVRFAPKRDTAYFISKVRALVWIGGKESFTMRKSPSYVGSLLLGG